MQQLNYDEWGKVTLDTNPGFLFAGHRPPFGFAGETLSNRPFFG